MRIVQCLAVLGICAIAGSAMATPPKPEPLPQQEQVQNQSQSQSLSSAQTQTANGGAGGSGFGTASNGSMTSTNRSVGIVNSAPIPPVCPAGLIPGRGRHRGMAGTVFALSAVCVAPGEAEAAAIREYREHELEMARLGVDAAKARADGDRAAVERIRAEACLTCGASK